MKILRYKINEETYGGLLIDEDGDVFCHTLEPSKEAIPLGIYELSIRYSPKFKRKTLWIRNVPGRDFILFHSGNTIKDSDGCILVGWTFDIQGCFISISKKTEEALFAKYEAGITRGEKYMVEVQNLLSTLTPL